MPANTPVMPTVEKRERVDRALLAVAHHLEMLAADRVRLARAAREGWEGPHRQRFDAERAIRDADLAAIVARCRRLAGR